MSKELKITRKLIDSILFSDSPKLEKTHHLKKVSWFIETLHSEKIYIPTDDYQRPFKPSMKQFYGIIDTINRNFMNQSITLTDIKKQIEFLTRKIETLDDVKEINEYRKHIEDYENLYQNGEGYHYTLDDGQHRSNYIMMFYFSVKSYYDILTEFDDFLNIELSTYFVWGVPKKSIVELFQSINTTRVINTDGKIWGEMSVFNDELKYLAKSDKRLNLFDNEIGSIESERSNYKLWFNILKICGYYDGINKSVSVGGKAMSEFVKKDNSLTNYTQTLNIYPRFLKIFNMLENVSGQYVIFNIYFLLHQLYLKNVTIDDNDIIKLVYVCNNEISSQAVSVDRYKSIIEITNKYLNDETLAN